MTKTGLPNLIALLVHGTGFAAYLFILYYSGYPQVYVKGCMYVFMAAMHLFLVIDEWHGINNFKQLQFNTINKALFISNFICIGCTIFGIFDGVGMMITYCMAVTITSSFILSCGLQHNYFKDER